MLPNADCVLKLMKQQTDALLQGDDKLEQFLLGSIEELNRLKFPIHALR
jgi:hypothetical protein